MKRELLIVATVFFILCYPFDGTEYFYLNDYPPLPSSS